MKRKTRKKSFAKLYKPTRILIGSPYRPNRNNNKYLKSQMAIFIQIDLIFPSALIRFHIIFPVGESKNEQCLLHVELKKGSTQKMYIYSLNNSTRLIKPNP